MLDPLHIRGGFFVVVYYFLSAAFFPFCFFCLSFVLLPSSDWCANHSLTHSSENEGSPSGLVNVSAIIEDLEHLNKTLAQQEPPFAIGAGATAAAGPPAAATVGLAPPFLFPEDMPSLEAPPLLPMPHQAAAAVAAATATSASSTASEDASLVRTPESHATAAAPAAAPLSAANRAAAAGVPPLCPALVTTANLSSTSFSASSAASSANLNSPQKTSFFTLEHLQDSLDSLHLPSPVKMDGGFEAADCMRGVQLDFGDAFGGQQQQQQAVTTPTTTASATAAAAAPQKKPSASAPSFPPAAWNARDALRAGGGAGSSGGGPPPLVSPFQQQQQQQQVQTPQSQQAQDPACLSPLSGMAPLGNLPVPQMQPQQLAELRHHAELRQKGHLSHISQGELSEETDELRRKLVAAQQVQMYAARSQLASMVAYQRQQQQVQQTTQSDTSMNSSHDSDVIRGDPELYRVKMCRNMVNTGECQWGANCGFAHAPHELRSRETNLDVLKRLYDACKPTVNPLKYKVIVCKKYEESMSCPYNEHCVYAHGMQERRTVQHNLQVCERSGLLVDTDAHTIHTHAGYPPHPAHLPDHRNLVRPAALRTLQGRWHNDVTR